MKNIICAVVLYLMFLCLNGCAGETQAAPVTATACSDATQSVTAPSETMPPVSTAEAVMAAPPEAAAPVVLEAEAPGILEERCDSAVIDWSNAADGYVMVCYSAETQQRLKVLVKGPTTTYTYNLQPESWTVFPLSDGNGAYQVSIYENVYDSKYAAVLSAELEVTLADEFAPFLRPNQYVDYSASSAAVAKGAELTEGLTEPLEKVAAVYDYVVATLSYDYDRAATVQSGYLPVQDQVLEEKKGICFDYAALMTAMLRSQQIPCKLVVGFAGQTYHAWISVWTREHGWVDGVIFFDGQTWKRMDPTFASSAKGDSGIMDFIENGDYTVKYLY